MKLQFGISLLIGTLSIAFGQLTEDWLAENVIDPNLIADYSIDWDRLFSWRIRLTDSDTVRMSCTDDLDQDRSVSDQLVCNDSSIYLINQPTSNQSRDSPVRWSKLRLSEIADGRSNFATYGRVFSNSSTSHFVFSIRNSRSDDFRDQSIRIEADFDRSKNSSSIDDLPKWRVVWERRDWTKSDEFEWPAGNAKFKFGITVSIYESDNYTLRIFDHTGEELFKRRFEFVKISRISYGYERFFNWPSTNLQADLVQTTYIRNLHIMNQSDYWLGDKDAFFPHDRVYMFECTFGGYPFAWENVGFYWKSANDYAEPKCGAKRVFDIGRDEPNGLKIFRYRAGPLVHRIRFLVKANESGTYSCHYNQSGPSQKSWPPPEFLVSDAPDGSGIYADLHQPKELSSSSQQIVEGDRVVLRCIVNRFRYRFPVWTSSANNFNADFHYDDGRIRTEYSKKHNSYIFDLIIKNVALNDSGRYSCKAGSSGVVDRRNSDPIEIVVTPKTAPHFGDRTQPTRAVQQEKNSRVEFYCDARGAPSPTIEWTKDRRAIDCSSNGSSMCARMKIVDERRRLIIVNTEATDGGLYSCVARNRLGQSTFDFTVSIEDPGRRQSIVLLTCLTMIAVVAMIFAVIAAKYWRSNREKAKFLRALKKVEQEGLEQKKVHGFVQPPVDSETPINRQMSVLLFHTGLEVPEEDLELQNVHLGEGAFGYVREGLLRIDEMSKPIPVAVKFIKERLTKDHQLQFANEIKLMQYLPYHVNVLSLLGVLSAHMSRGKLGAILEYCEHRSLWDYVYQRSGKAVALPEEVGHAIRPTYCTLNVTPLKSIYSTAIMRVNEIIPMVHLLFFAYQIARGLAHLISERIVHGDVALRNILLAQAEIDGRTLLVVKVADFGLARSQDGQSGDCDRRLPFKWTALEVLSGDEAGDEASDVWSFGVVLWELFSEGHTPYPEFETDSSLREYLKEGGRLPQPKKCPREIYSLMTRCWKPKKPRRPRSSTDEPLLENPRPTFAECQDVISAFAQSTYAHEWPRLLDDLEQDSIHARVEIENLKNLIRSRNIESNSVGTRMYV